MDDVHSIEVLIGLEQQSILLIHTFSRGPSEGAHSFFREVVPSVALLPPDEVSISDSLEYFVIILRINLDPKLLGSRLGGEHYPDCLEILDKSLRFLNKSYIWQSKFIILVFKAARDELLCTLTGNGKLFNLLCKLVYDLEGVNQLILQTFSFNVPCLLFYFGVLGGSDPVPFGIDKCLPEVISELNSKVFTVDKRIGCFSSTAKASWSTASFTHLELLRLVNLFLFFLCVPPENIRARKQPIFNE